MIPKAKRKKEGLKISVFFLSSKKMKVVENRERNRLFRKTNDINTYASTNAQP